MSGHFVDVGEMTLDELAGELEKAGWRIYRGIGLQKGTTWYACYSLDGYRECASNEKPVQLCLQPYRAVMDGVVWESVEISIRAAWPDADTWWDLKAYSLPPGKAWEQWEDIGRRLRRAWMAL